MGFIPTTESDLLINVWGILSALVMRLFYCPLDFHGKRRLRLRIDLVQN
jgi:hypothetical protein